VGSTRASAPRTDCAIKVLKKPWGIRDINTTLAVYTHPSVEEKKNALASVSMTLLSGAKTS
jgi:hypothetical protein